MLNLLDKIEKYDRKLVKLSCKAKTNIARISSVTSQKERLISQLDAISYHAKESHDQLESIANVCQQVRTHEMYAQLEQLKTLTHYRIQEVIDKEDTNNPIIVQKLNECRESLELDIKISKVPKQNRHFFMYLAHGKG
jgi:hypothetical protein